MPVGSQMHVIPGIWCSGFISQHTEVWGGIRGTEIRTWKKVPKGAWAGEEGTGGDVIPSATGMWGLGVGRKVLECSTSAFLQEKNALPSHMIVSSPHAIKQCD